VKHRDSFFMRKCTILVPHLPTHAHPSRAPIRAPLPRRKGRHSRRSRPGRSSSLSLLARARRYCVASRAPRFATHPSHTSHTKTASSVSTSDSCLPTDGPNPCTKREANEQRRQRRIRSREHAYKGALATCAAPHTKQHVGPIASPPEIIPRPFSINTAGVQHAHRAAESSPAAPAAVGGGRRRGG
jgi:hypothetical protein